LVRRAFDELGAGDDSDAVSLRAFRDTVQRLAGPGAGYTDGEWTAALEQMQAENVLFVHDDLVTLI
jgi:hypothetical protein